MGFPGLGGGVRRGGGIGIGTIVIAMLVAWLLGINPLTLLGMFAGDGGPVIEQSRPSDPSASRSAQPGAQPGQADAGRDFVSVVLDPLSADEIERIAEEEEAQAEAAGVS